LLKFKLYAQRIVIQDPASSIRSIGSHVWWHDALQKGFAIASTREGREEERRGGDRSIFVAMNNILHNWPQWKWENAAAGAVAGLTTVVALHPLDIVRTRFQG